MSLNRDRRVRQKSQRPIRNTRAIGLLIGAGLCVAAACTDARPGTVQTAAPASAYTLPGGASDTPPTVHGIVPAGTPLANIPPLSTRIPSSSTPDTALYVIENHGKPHFIEFHAWW